MWLWNWVRSRLLLHVPASEHSPLFSSDCNLLEAFLEEALSNEVATRVSTLDYWFSLQSGGWAGSPGTWDERTVQ